MLTYWYTILYARHLINTASRAVCSVLASNESGGPTLSSTSIAWFTTNTCFQHESTIVTTSIKSHIIPIYRLERKSRIIKIIPREILTVVWLENWPSSWSSVLVIFFTFHKKYLSLVSRNSTEWFQWTTHTTCQMKIFAKQRKQQWWVILNTVHTTADLTLFGFSIPIRKGFDLKNEISTILRQETNYPTSQIHIFDNRKK